jgi:hypothetical protein
VARILQRLATDGMAKEHWQRENSMETAGQEVGKIETRLRQLGAKLDRLVAKADEVGTDAKIDFRRRIDDVRDKRALVQSRLDAYKAANGQKWESFKGGVKTAWHELEDALKAIKQ